jgi:hypothetical protein
LSVGATAAQIGSVDFDRPGFFAAKDLSVSPMPPDWLYLERVLDLFALSDLVTRAEEVVEDLVLLLGRVVDEQPGLPPPPAMAPTPSKTGPCRLPSIVMWVTSLPGWAGLWAGALARARVVV